MAKDKKTLIYEAALSLVDENYDLSRIKVADIAERANIGKSTVYEYFNSKEQVIGEALLHMFNQGIKSFQQYNSEETSFKEVFYYLMESLSTMMRRNRNLYDLMAMNTRDLEVHTAITTIMQGRLLRLRDSYLREFEQLVDKSVREGIIKEKPPQFDWQAAIISAMLHIGMHKQFEGEFQLTEEEVLEKAYNAYVKLLS